MRVVIDIEANGLHNPDKIWVIVTKDIDTNETRIFRNVTEDRKSKEDALLFLQSAVLLVGHNILGYDLPLLQKHIGFIFDVHKCIDTLIVSRLLNYSKNSGHSIEAYGKEFGLEKKLPSNLRSFFSQWSQELEDYCVRDVEICHRIYSLFSEPIRSGKFDNALALEQDFQSIVNSLHNNGFCFDVPRAAKLLDKVNLDLGKLDNEIHSSFPPRQILVREFTPRATKFGTISKASVPRHLRENIKDYVIGQSYPIFRTAEFNPSSHKQIIEVLNAAGWEPTHKTKTHIEAIRGNTVTDKHKTYGWKVNEENLSTLPVSAPAPARSLARRILLESRRRSLVEWLGLVKDDNRIHGEFFGIGAWTHRMAHRNPNTANIPREFKEDGTKKLLGKELRQLWRAPKNRLLVGVDAEGIQLRIFAHYINDKEFTNALVNGRKSDKSDPHSLNQRVLGPACRTRQAAKRFIYALLLGAGLGKLDEILEASRDETESALSRLLARYQGFAYLKEHIIPGDAKRGFFIGIDGRAVKIPGDTERDRRHLCMSGYLQNGEAIVIKKAALLAKSKLDRIRRDDRQFEWSFINIVHDELQFECNNDMSVALKIAKTVADSIREAGEYYKLKCPMAGSYYNEDIKDYTIGTTWYQTH